jgi:chromosome segregation ATPase
MGRDDLLTLAQYGLVCCEELDTMRPSELNQLKAAVTMPSIDERAAYLNELRRESERLEKLRFHADLVGWAEADTKRTVAEREGATIAESEQAAQKELASLEGEWAALKDDVARARERLSDLRAKDKTGLVGQEKAAAQRLSEAERKLSDAERVLAEDRRSAQEAEKAAKSAREHRASAFRKQADDLMSGGKTANFSSGGIADALYGADARDLTELFAEARARATVEINARSGSSFSCHRRIRTA